MASFTTLSWILATGLLMCPLALVGGLALLLPESTLKRLLLPLVALSAGSLLGGALFHLMPRAVEHGDGGIVPWISCVAGFTTFLLLEQFLHWHHCHRTTSEHARPLNTLILVADGVHNLVGGLAVGASFVLDVRVGLAAWLAAVAHEIPQELGDFGVLVHGGWSPRRALLLNFFSALTFPVGGILAWLAAAQLDLSFLVAFAAGNFLYIAAADLVPEIRHESLPHNALHFGSFVVGLLALLALTFLHHH